MFVWNNHSMCYKQTGRFSSSHAIRPPMTLLRMQALKLAPETCLQLQKPTKRVPRDRFQLVTPHVELQKPRRGREF